MAMCAYTRNMLPEDLEQAAKTAPSFLHTILHTKFYTKISLKTGISGVFDLWFSLKSGNPVKIRT